MPPSGGRGTSKGGEAEESQPQRAQKYPGGQERSGGQASPLGQHADTRPSVRVYAPPPTITPSHNYTITSHTITHAQHTITLAHHHTITLAHHHTCIHTHRALLHQGVQRLNMWPILPDSNSATSTMAPMGSTAINPDGNHSAVLYIELDSYAHSVACPTGGWGESAPA